jgi:hypothetical protein
MMETDFPAAHSTDSSWYAVDRQGNVALFITGAGGAIPNGAYTPGEFELLEDLDPEDLEEMGYTGGLPEDVDQKLLPDRGQVFVYRTGKYDECLAERYHRSQQPKKPVHVDQLAPEVRERLSRCRFDNLDFAKTEILQPVELKECSTWDAAYLASDGKTVRAVPGREDEYPQSVEELRYDSDELTFEDPPKKKRSSRRKKKGGGDGE